MDFTNKVAIVTGAGSGMGLLCACEIARGGGHVVLADIHRASLDAAVKKAEAFAPERVIGCVCDVRDYTAVCAVRDAAIERFGAVDILVNLAGGAETRMLGVSGEFPDIPIDVYDWGIDVNLKGQFYFCHAVMKQMRVQKSGVIINIGSITGEEGCELNAAYATAKSGVMNGLTKSMALYGSRYGIRCVCISPGPVLTRPGMASMKTALGRAATPEEMTELILFVASDKGAFINGVNILSDGGRSIMRNKG